MRPLDEVLAEYREQGVARLGKILPEELRLALARRLDDIMLGRVVYPGMFFQRDTDTGEYRDLVFGRGYEGATFKYRKIEKLEMDPLYLGWLRSPLFAEIATRILGPEVTLYRALVFNKEAESGGSNIPWHQDGGLFWGLSRDPELQIWTALDDCPLHGGCVEYVPGSHKRGIASPLGGVIQPEVVAQYEGEKNAVPIPVEAGECLMIHNHVWHRSGRSTSGKPRRALTVCYMEESVRCKRTKRTPRNFVRLFGEGLPPTPLEETLVQARALLAES
jgi:phytanoyl-CoA hydroxylase